MEIERYGKPMGLPEDYEALVLMDPPANLDIDGSTAESDGVWLYTDEGKVYIFDVEDIKCFDSDFKIYMGSCCLMDRDEDSIEAVDGEAYLLIRHDGKSVRQGELWIEKA